MTAAAYATKQEFPLTKAKLQKFTALQLEEMRSAGIEYVSIIGGACAAANTIKDQLIKIAEAKPLPLVGCDNESCMCIYGAKEKPRTEAQRQAVDQALKERGISFKVTWK